MTENDRQRRLSRLEALLIRRATEPLENLEEASLGNLLDEFPEADTEAFERVAAAIWLAASAYHEPMPLELRDRILEQSDAFAHGASDGRRPGDE